MMVGTAPQEWMMPFTFQSWVLKSWHPGHKLGLLLMVQKSCASQWVVESLLIFMVLYIPGGWLNFFHQYLLITSRSNVFFNKKRLNHEDAGYFQSWCRRHPKSPAPIEKRRKTRIHVPSGVTILTFPDEGSIYWLKIAKIFRKLMNRLNSHSELLSFMQGSHIWLTRIDGLSMSKHQP